jgi:mono/diheme cytochrome c family protein
LAVGIYALVVGTARQAPLALQRQASATDAASKTDRWGVPPGRTAIPNPVPRTEKAIAMGRTLFHKQCATCHGRAGKNDGPGASGVAQDIQRARFLTDPELQAESDGSLFWKIREGRGPMPSTEKRLRDEERWQIVHYLRALASR